MPLMPSLSKDLGIDLGTIQTRIADGSSLLVDEPTIVAIVVEEQKIVALGKEAREMYGRVLPETIEVASPMQNGVVADYEITEALLAYLKEKNRPVRLVIKRLSESNDKIYEYHDFELPVEDLKLIGLDKS